MIGAGIGIIVFGLLFALAGYMQRRKAAKILSTPFKKTGEIAANPAVADAKGLVSCEGAVQTQQPIMAPCSNTPCVYYELKVEKRVEHVKMTDKGRQVTREWRNVSEQKQGSYFQLNDGSGPIGVDGREGLDADLKQSYSGAPPGGQGLGILANLLTGALFSAGEAVLEYRATEKILPAQGNLFAMGKLSGGQLTKPDGMMGKLILSPKTRDGLVGSVKTMSTLLFVGSGLVAVAGICVMIFVKPAKGQDPCPSTLTDAPATSCMAALKTNKPDTYAWSVTKPGIYTVEITQPKDATESMWAYVSVTTKDNFPITDPFDIMSTKQDASVSKGDYTILINNLRDNTGIEGGFRYILNVTYKGPLKDDATQKASKDDKGGDEGDDKGAPAASGSKGAAADDK